MFEFDAPTAEEAATGGNFLELPGKFHAVIQHAEENAMRGEKMVKGFMLEIAVHGTEAGKECEIGKTFKLYFANGEPTHKDGGKFMRAKQLAALVAGNALDPSKFGQKVTIDLEGMTNHQVCVKLSLGDVQPNGKQYLDLDGASIFHIDDPRAKSFPKNAEILEHAKNFRRDESFFDALVKAKPSPAPKRLTDDDLSGL